MALPIIGQEFLIVGEDPKLSFTPAGLAVCNFRVKASDRVKDEATGQWKDGKVLWANVTVWRDPAQHVVDSLKSGDLCLVTGKLYTREFEHQGVKKMAIEIDATSVGASLTFRTTPHGAAQQQQSQPQAQPQAQPQQGYGQPQQGYGQPQGQPGQWAAQPQAQPAPQQGGQWSNQPPAQQDPWAQPQQGQPPF